MIDLRNFLASRRNRRATQRGPKRARLGFERLERREVPAVLLVGPTRAYKLPSQAAAVAHDGDSIQIDAGIYKGDFAVWRANNLTITGVGGRAKLDATGVAISNRKGIWVVDGADTTVRNVEFAGAHDAAGLDKNWAGIRLEGGTLTVDNCYFHDNDDGLLTGANATSDVYVKGSEFASNGYGDGYSHDMYVGQVRSFTLEFSSVHDAKVGHLVKSRAQTNFIRYNRLMEGAGGTTSLAVDLPNGGASYVIGNVIGQGTQSANSGMLSYAEEGATNASQRLYMVNNTFVNDLGRGTFVAVRGTPTDVRLTNNIFAGAGTVLSGPGTLTTNLVASDPRFVNRAAGDYHLAAGSPAINVGTDPGSVDGVALKPVYEYSNLSGVARRKNGALDIGAFEY